MITYVSADYIYPITTSPIKNGVLGLLEDGTIAAVLAAEEAKHLSKITHYEGVIVPGFINTHCHLELSHLKNKIAEKTGLPVFIRQILALRQQPEEEVIAAMQLADEEMYSNGIVAVGDISNVLLSKTVKLKSKIYYHTFIEVLGFNRPSEPIISGALQIKKDFAPLKSSIVPHAPYSVSNELFNEISKITEVADVLSIHNQETEGENELFENGTGIFAEFFADLGIAQSADHHSGRNSIRYHLPKMPKNVNTLLVHNTVSSKADVKFAKNEHQQLYWCLCPNANLYIEDTLPNVSFLMEEGVKITLGTDSLASNHQLSILAEMQVLQVEKNITFDESIKWATLNGAEFLGIDQQYGSLALGKKPGIILIQLDKNFNIINTLVRRLM